MKTEAQARAALESLTSKQRQVAEMLVHGLTAREIAEVLFVSEHTAKTHRYDLYKRLGIKKPGQLGVLLAMAGVVTDWESAA